MIAVDRAAEPELIEPPPVRAAVARTKGGRFGLRVSAGVLLIAILGTLGGGGLNSGSSIDLQARAVALHAKWAEMRTNGIPDEDLAQLEQEWRSTQATMVLGAGSTFWWPGARQVVDRWQAETDRIWSRELSRFRTEAVIAEQSLHRALGSESPAQRSARLEALVNSSTPGEFASLGTEWALEARLVPIDARIAVVAGGIGGETLLAKSLGIRSDPAAEVLARADAYTQLEAQDRMARAELLTRSLVSIEKDLQGRLDAAAVTQQAFQHASDEADFAALYGVDPSGYQAGITTDRDRYGKALTVAEFNSIGADLKQIASTAESAVYTVLSQTHVIGGVAFYYQDHPLSCEEAATSMALTHQGVYVSQDQILAEMGADRHPMYVDGAGRVRWGNPYETFVGNVNGSESNYTGFGTYYPPLVRVAQAHGARVLAYGYMSAATIYARVIAGHPVVAFATWDWQWHPRRDYLSFDGQWIPWIGPYYSSHVYTVVGVSPGGVLVNDPIRGQYWVGKGAFEAGYSDFNEAIVFA